MAQGEGNGGGVDDDLIFFALIIGAYIGIVYLIDSYPVQVLSVWKWIRAIECIFILKADIAKQILTYNWLTYDFAYHNVNQLVWDTYKWSFVFLIPVLLKYKSETVKNTKYMLEEYLDTIFNRFPHLKSLWTPSGKSFRVIKEFPFIIYGSKGEFNPWPDIKAYTPESFYHEHKNNLDEALKSHIGPEIIIENGQIKWQDPFAKFVVTFCLKALPENPNDPLRRYRSTAWKRCIKIHHYERTLALGLYEAASNMGVLAPQMMLYLKQNAKDLKKYPKHTAYINWRNIVSFGGGVSAAETTGIHGHYLYEKTLWAYHESRIGSPDYDFTDDIIFQIGRRPYLLKAVEAFAELNHELNNQREKEKRA